MLVEITKNWGVHKKGAQIEIKDKTVLDKGFKTKLFKEVKSKSNKED